MKVRTIRRRLNRMKAHGWTFHPWVRIRDLPRKMLDSTEFGFIESFRFVVLGHETKTYGAARAFASEGDMYEGITGRRSAVIDLGERP